MRPPDLRRWRPAYTWVLVIGALTALISVYALRNHTNGPDEQLYMATSRWVNHHLPSSLWSLDGYARGTQRLNVFILSLSQGLFWGPGAWKLAHILGALAWASTVIPVYLVGRGVGLGRRTALVGGVLAVLGPLAVTATTFLPDGPAYPAFAWALWAMVRAVAAPSLGRDVVALALIVLAAAGRTNLVYLPVVLIAAAVLREVPGGVLTSPVRAARAHPLLVAVTVAGLVAVVTGALDSLSGDYSSALHVSLPPDLVADRAIPRIASLVVATAIVPAAFGLPWLAESTVAARDPGRHAFGLVSVLAAIGMLITLYSATDDGRYVLELLPLIWISALAAVTTQRPSLTRLLIGGGAALFLVAYTNWPARGPFDYFTNPGGAVFAQSWVAWVAREAPQRFGLQTGTIEIGIAAGAIAVAALAQWRFGRRGAVAVLGVAAVFQILAFHNAMDGFLSAASADAPPGFSARTWVDRATPRGTDVGWWSFGAATTPNGVFQFTEVHYFNQAISGSVTSATVAINRATGAITGPVPDYLVLPTRGVGAQPRGRVVATGAYIGLVLLRRADPAGVTTLVADADASGHLPANHDATIYAYAPAGPRPCLVVSVDNLADDPALTPQAAVVTTGDQRLTLPAAGGSASFAPIPLRRLDAGAQRDAVTIHATAALHRADGTTVGPTVASANVVPCF